MKRLIIIASIISVMLAGCNRYGEKLEFKQGQLFYTKNVNKKDAQKLSEFLVKSGFYDGTAKTVQLDKNADTFYFRMVVKEEKQQEKETVDLLQLFAFYLSDEVFNGAPVNVHICNDKLKTVKTIYPYPNFLPKINVNNGIIFHSSSLDNQILKEIIENLEKNHFFRGAFKQVVIEDSANVIYLKLKVDQRQLKSQNFEKAMLLLAYNMSKDDVKGYNIHFLFCDKNFKVIRRLN